MSRAHRRERHVRILAAAILSPHVNGIQERYKSTLSLFWVDGEYRVVSGVLTRREYLSHERVWRIQKGNEERS